MIEGFRTGGQLLFSDFSSHNPKTASGITSHLKDDEGNIVLERTYSNDEGLSKRDLLVAASRHFAADVQAFARGTLDED